MTDVPHGTDWWRANDGKWYPAELRAERRPPAATLGTPPISPAAVARHAMAASEPPIVLEDDATPPTAAPAAAPVASGPAADGPGAAPTVLMELRGSALTSDIDRIGDRMEITEEGVSQRGRGNKDRGALAMADIASVDAEKTHKGYWLRVRAADGRELLQQGLEAGPAEAARDLIRSHAPAAAQAAVDAERAAAAAEAASQAAGAEHAVATAPAPAAADATSTADIPDQIRKLAELHQQGILTDEEFQTKKQELLDRM